MFDTKNFKAIMQERGVSLLGLAQKTKMNYGALHGLVNGKTESINFEYLKKICKALECTPNDILKH